MRRLQKIGQVPAKNSAEIPFSRIGVGFEKLDRALFEPEKAYDLVAGIGVKYARIQSGWMRTEKEKGVYDFAWLDDIVDNLLARGIEPWINLVYGNPIYTNLAKEFFGAVGCPPMQPEERKAWCDYVTATVKHFDGRVSKYEIWNEPDCPYSWKVEEKFRETGKGTPDGTEYGLFAIDTAKAIRAGSANTYIIGFALGHPNECSFLNNAMKTGVGEYLDAASYHSYLVNSLKRERYFQNFESIVHTYAPNLEIIQGESGTQSEFSYAGALRLMNWNREKQAKHLLRLMVTDLAMGCRFVSYFSALDMVEALHCRTGEAHTFEDYGYFGVISAEFDENGLASGEYSKKQSYFALQTIAALFEGDVKRESVPAFLFAEQNKYINGFDYDGPEMAQYAFRLADGSQLVTYWRNSDLLTTSFEGTASYKVLIGQNVELIDLMDGSIYKIPEEMIVRSTGCIQLKNIPLRDYPLALHLTKEA